MKQDWKTTLTAIVTAIVSVLAHFNIIISPEWQGIIITIGVLIVGLLAKDSTKNQISSWVLKFYFRNELIKISRNPAKTFRAGVLNILSDTSFFLNSPRPLKKDLTNKNKYIIFVQNLK